MANSAVYLAMEGQGTQALEILSDTWSGDLSGEVTTKAAVCQYDINYGCYRKVGHYVINDEDGNADIAMFDACSGGSTPDGLCNRRRVSEVLIMAVFFVRLVVF